MALQSSEARFELDPSFENTGIEEFDLLTRRKFRVEENSVRIIDRREHTRFLLKFEIVFNEAAHGAVVAGQPVWLEICRAPARFASLVDLAGFGRPVKQNFLFRLPVQESRIAFERGGSLRDRVDPAVAAALVGTVQMRLNDRLSDDLKKKFFVGDLQHKRFWGF